MFYLIVVHFLIHYLLFKNFALSQKLVPGIPLELLLFTLSIKKYLKYKRVLLSSNDRPFSI